MQRVLALGAKLASLQPPAARHGGIVEAQVDLPGQAITFKGFPNSDCRRLSHELYSTLGVSVNGYGEFSAEVLARSEGQAASVAPWDLPTRQLAASGGTSALTRILEKVLEEIRHGVDLHFSGSHRADVQAAFESLPVVRDSLENVARLLAVSGEPVRMKPYSVPM